MWRRELQRFDVSRAYTECDVSGCFGSRGRGEARVSSDIDLLVDLRPGRDLLDLAGFKLDLEDVLGCKVDVVTERSLSPYLRERIVAEARPL
jgi:predicted nucleotidyltransferase